MHRHQQTGHMIASDPIRSLHQLLQVGGRPHMGPRFRGDERTQNTEFRLIETRSNRLETQHRSASLDC